VTYDNCTEAYRDGIANIPRTHPSYAAHLDRDNDGIGCDKPPAGFKPRTAAETPAPAKAPHPITGQRTTTAVTGQNHLPTTGPGDIGVVGGLVLAAGVAAAVLAKRKHRTFKA
jgi:hypothetical protein